jgi:hypothetical protein
LKTGINRKFDELFKDAKDEYGEYDIETTISM